MLHYYFQTKLYMKRITYFIFLVFCLSCHKEEDTILDSSGVAVKLPSLWNTSISDDGKLAQVIIKDAIIYNGNNALVGGNKNGDRSIISINGESGSKNWEWSDLLGLLKNPSYKDPFYIYPSGYVYQENNSLIFPYSTSTYNIDLNKGETRWKHKVALQRWDNITGIGNIFYTGGSPYDSTESAMIYRGRTMPELKEQAYLSLKYQNNPSKKGEVRDIHAFIYNSDTLLHIIYTEPISDKNDWDRQYFASLYNCSKKLWVYEQNTFYAGAGGARYKDNYIYYFIGTNSAMSIRCDNMMTGEQIWVSNVEGVPLTSWLLLADGHLYSAGEDRMLYCIDASSGRRLWTVPNTGTCSNLSYLNGILYYLGGGDGLLHAVDTATGKHLWKLKSPDLSTNSGAWFYGTCVAVPGKDGKKGTVIATTGIHAYGYEAIR
jgi:outer membrane protein assembly factor BamB